MKHLKDFKFSNIPNIEDYEPCKFYSASLQWGYWIGKDFVFWQIFRIYYATFALQGRWTYAELGNNDCGFCTPNLASIIPLRYSGDIGLARTSNSTDIPNLPGYFRFARILNWCRAWQQRTLPWQPAGILIKFCWTLRQLGIPDGCLFPVQRVERSRGTSDTAAAVGDLGHHSAGSFIAYDYLDVA